MPSRRTFLRGGSVVGLAALCGCATSQSAPAETTTQPVECQAATVEQNYEGNALADVDVTITDGSVLLVIELSAPPEEVFVGRIFMEDARGTLVGEIPTTDAQTYRYNLGEPPLHGRLRVVAEKSVGPNVDSATVQFNCSTSDQ